MNDLIAVIGGVTFGAFIGACVTAWERRPTVVRSDLLGRWVAARSCHRFEANEARRVRRVA